VRENLFENVLNCLIFLFVSFIDKAIVALNCEFSPLFGRLSVCIADIHVMLQKHVFLRCKKNVDFVYFLIKV